MQTDTVCYNNESITNKSLREVTAKYLRRTCCTSIKCMYSCIPNRNPDCCWNLCVCNWRYEEFFLQI